tara:strand:+ start:171 stop:440 length:270 start_codon:yes stop_codon:yes gene_type:complete
MVVSVAGAAGALAVSVMVEAAGAGAGLVSGVGAVPEDEEDEEGAAATVVGAAGLVRGAVVASGWRKAIVWFAPSSIEGDMGVSDTPSTP